MQRIFIIFITLFCYKDALSQTTKAERLPFCGPSYSNKTKMQKALQDQFQFLNLQSVDTVVDIGAQSGWYSAAYAAVTSTQHITFILVDIDMVCLNPTKLENMLTHYAKMRDAVRNNSYKIINNTVDSLWLPADTYNKVWLMNTLHEIPNPLHFLKDINNVMRKGGEIVILEMIPQRPKELHAGCRKPLLTMNELKNLFASTGFRYDDRKELVEHGKVTKHMLRFIKQD